MVNSRAKGIDAEQAAARYFREQGRPWESARRAVAAGWSNASSSSQDPGDLAGLPGLCVQVKNLARTLDGKLLDDVWIATTRQAATTGGIPLILEKTRSTDVGRWWLHLNSQQYVRVVTGEYRFTPSVHLVRVRLGDLVSDLRIYSLEFVANAG